MTDREFLHRRKIVRLMKLIAEQRREREVRESRAEAARVERSAELDENLQRLKELAAKLDRLRAPRVDGGECTN